MEKGQIQRIAALMEAKGMNIATLAKESGVNHMTIRRILKKESYNSTIDTIKSIASALGVDEGKIIGDKDYPPNVFNEVKGYLEYQGHISKIETFKQLESIYQKIKDDLTIPRNAKNIMRDEADPTKYKTIIFDFDGTLLETKCLKQYEYLFKNPPRGSDEWKQGRKEYLSHIKDCKQWKGMDMVIEFIRQNKIPTAIVTANTKDRVKEAIKVFGWHDVFSLKNIFGCYSLGKDMTTKDDGNPALFQKAIDEMGTPAANCISLGNEISDYKAASSIGIEAYNCYWGAKDEDKHIMYKEMRDVTLKRPKDIIEVLKRSLI